MMRTGSRTLVLAAEPAPGLLAAPCRYLDIHAWFLCLALLDVVLTTIILRLGGSEANAVARGVLHAAGVEGMVAFKFAAAVLVLCICEAVGRRREPLGRNIALFGVAANTVAVTLGAMYLVLFSTAGYL